MICSVDLLATAAAITGRPLPDGAGPDSRDILPALLQEKPDRPCRETLVMQATPLAVRRGSWKLIPSVGRPNGSTRPAELYDLANDLAESNNLAAKHPDKVRELTDLLAAIRK